MSTFYMPPRGAPGSPVFDPDNVRSLLGFFDDLEYCFKSAGIQDETAKKQHATRYAPDSEKTIWRSFPEFTDRDSDYDAFKKAIIKDYIGGSLFSIHDLTSLVESTTKTGISSIKSFSEYSRRFRDIASSLVSSGYLRDHERDHLFLQGIEDSLRQAVLQRLHVTQPFVLFPRHQYSIQQVTIATHHVLDSAITPATTAPSQPELVEATQALVAAKAAVVQVQTQQQFLSQPVSRLSTVPTPAYSPHLSAAHLPTAPTPAHSVQVSASRSQLPASAPAYSNSVPHFDYEERLTQMRRQLAALEQQRAAHHAASHATTCKDRRPLTTDNFDMQISAARRTASPSPQPEPHKSSPVVSAPVPPPSRFKLPVVYVSMTSAPLASTTQRIIALSPPSASFEVPRDRLCSDMRGTHSYSSPDRSSCPSLTANFVPPSVYRPPVQDLSLPSSHLSSRPHQVVPLSASAVPPLCPVYHQSPPASSPPPSHSPSALFSLPSTPTCPPQVLHLTDTHPTPVSHLPADSPTPPSPSSPCSPRPVPPSSNAPIPTSQASHPVAAHPRSSLHSTSIFNVSSLPSPPSPLLSPSPSSSTTPPISNNPANAISKTSSPVTPLPLSCLSALRPSPIVQKYVHFPPSISRFLTVQLSGNRSRRLDTFDFLFSYIRPPSPMTLSLLPTGMRRPSRSLTRMLASQATQSPPAPIQHRTRHALRLRALRTSRKIAPPTYHGYLDITSIASPRRLPLLRATRVRVCTSNPTDMKSRRDRALRPRFSRRLTHLRITLSTMLDDDIPRRTHARTGRPASDPRRPPVRFDSSEEEPLSPSCTTPCSQRGLLHAPLAASPPIPPALRAAMPRPSVCPHFPSEPSRVRPESTAPTSLSRGPVTTLSRPSHHSLTTSLDRGRSRFK